MKNAQIDLSGINQQFPRASAYDLHWVLENQMGPNVLWLAEALCQVLDLKPGMRVLDLGCGKAVSSIFLAKEFGLQVWAADLWIKPGDNWTRIQQAGLQDQVFPIYAEAHALPFADEYFDAVISLDGYHYFGTDDLYLGYYLARHLKPTGQLGIAVPGLLQEFSSDVPEPLKPYWEWDFCSFHSPGWWRYHWEKTGIVAVEHADSIPEGWKHWLIWQESLLQNGFPYNAKEAEMLRVDAGRSLGFTRVVARKLPLI
jgi:SAM-dependent methyltransferase